MRARWMPFVLLVPALLLALASGCEEDRKRSGDDDDDGGAAGGTSTSTVTGTGDGNATLTVTSAILRSSLEGSTPQQGRLFLELDLTLANQSVPQPLRADLTLFSVLTAGNLQVSASGMTSYLDNACSSDLSVASGGSLSCGLLFEVPENDAPAQLGYDDLTSEVSLSAPIPAAQRACIPLRDAGQQSTKPACSGCTFDYCYQYIPPPECTQNSCILGCLECPCEDNCNVAACTEYLEPLRACLDQYCTVPCEGGSAP